MEGVAGRMDADETHSAMNCVQELLFSCRRHRRILVGSGGRQIAGGEEHDGSIFVEVRGIENRAVFARGYAEAVLLSQGSDRVVNDAGLAVFELYHVVLKAGGLGENQHRLLCGWQCSRGKSKTEASNGPNFNELTTRKFTAHSFPPVLVLNFVTSKALGQMVARADCQGHHGERRILARRRHEARTVGHYDIRNIVRLAEWVEHRFLRVSSHASGPDLVNRHTWHLSSSSDANVFGARGFEHFGCTHS